jgi:hypothetical protein
MSSGNTCTCSWREIVVSQQPLGSLGLRVGQLEAGVLGHPTDLLRVGELAVIHARLEIFIGRVAVVQLGLVKHQCFPFSQHTPPEGA